MTSKTASKCKELRRLYCLTIYINLIHNVDVSVIVGVYNGDFGCFISNLVKFDFEN